MREKQNSWNIYPSDQLFTAKWEPDTLPAKAIILIIHGISEHSGRYALFARELTEAGYIVYAYDQRGHGKTAEKQGLEGFAGQDGWNHMVHDVYDSVALIKKENPGLPLFIFGHSMGSFILQHYMHLYGDEQGVQGVILSGPGGDTTFMLYFGRFLCRMMALVKGKLYKSKFIHELTFKNFNARCAETRTEFDWLTTNPLVVDEYIQDIHCGGTCTLNFYHDFFAGILQVQKKSNIRKIPKDIPILILSGQMDPVGHYGEIITALRLRYQQAGIRDVTVKQYENCRHELHNETDRSQVLQDIIQWLSSKIGKNNIAHR
ncbi:Lysophospholipase [Dehalobacter sp. UNSWDHB]|jgi:Lysophospholipase|uniref:alpha/beta hydrolase n=1 Tax=unclassified Dehalobacter TaxID=2635733 RepID=UPI00028A48CE|nr:MULTISPECIES: alpha/beta hydrolase [unclassified Dehalobacter]AFV01710.1 Lysophospholipase; Monoglyceride lipase [Dehalobacter sp. DCA]AFV04748.1 Lysophospholipase; Monoglyceride lipase; putative [Dehalobacter sp. CF]EQB22771.1 Lysophospholipase [Dehalobacter sp. UNSWDHB]